MSENCYLLLELEFDPPVEDQAVIDQKIEKKRKFWSTNSNHFKKGAEYKRYLEMLPQIKEIMSDPVKRKKEADSACSIVYDPIDQDIKILSTTGEITEDIIKNYANAKKISVNVVKKRVSALGIKIIQKVDFQITYDKYYKNKPKNAEVFDGMKTYLKPFNEENYYSFLNKSEDETCDKLKKRAQEKKIEFCKNDTYSSAGKKVCTACEDTFMDKSSKTIYDDYLTWCKSRSILDNAKEIAGITDKKLSDEQGDIYIEKLTELLKDRTLAENIFISFCKIEKIEYNPDLYNPGKKEEKARKEAEYKKRQEAEEKARKEAEYKKRQEAARQEAARQEAARQEAARREAARQEAARREAARQEAIRKAKHNRQKLAIIALCLLIFCVVALRNATDLKDSQSTPSGVSQAPIDTIVSNVNDTNSKDTTNVIKKTELSVANFRSDTTSGEAPLNVEFTDESTESPASWKWDFGDGSTSTKQNPEHTYSTAGVYTVKETVTNEAGENTETKKDYVTVTDSLQIPAADFSVSETSGEAPLTVTFTDESTESPTEWKWDFGDGSTSTKKNPEHTYSTAGVYTVEETVTNEVDEDTETKTEYITVTAPLQIPAADFSVSETSGEAPLTVKFTDKSTESPTEWKWDFGDGNVSTKQNPEHTYSTAGAYTVKETVTNEAGEDTETKKDHITVTTPEKINSDPDTASDYPTKNEISTFVNGYQGVSDLIETVSENSKSDHPEWKWDIWKDQSGNKVISFYYYQNNSKGYESIYFDSEGNIISKKGLELTLIYSYP